MIVAGSASPLLLSSAGGYNLTNSLRFRASASAYLNRTPASSGNLNLWTLSWWTKRGQLSTAAQTTMFGTDYASSQEFMLQFTANNRLVFEQYASGGATNLGNLISTQVFRDPSAWYHIVVTWDSAQATASNRIKIYVNGSQITAFDTASYPAQNASSVWNQATNQHRIGQYSTAKYYDGYMTEINFIDGQALTPSSFGETSATTGVWIPKKYTGTYGTNGFYLPFTDNSALTTSSNVGLGKDFSGNANYWTTNNISITSGATYDSMTDVPTLTSATAANYCVLSPIDTYDNPPTAGNLSRVGVGHSGSPWSTCRATLGVSTGKWYFEATLTGSSGSYQSNSMVGIITTTTSTLSDAYGGSTTRSYQANGNLQGDNSTGSASSAVSGDVIMCAFDIDAGKVWFGKNGTWFNSGVPASGTGNVFTSVPATPIAPQVSMYGNSGDNNGWFMNFGQRPFAYTPPTGFVRLNTFNLPTPTIGATASTQANKYFDALLYTGNGSASQRTDISWANMQPDMVWIKNRTSANNHVLHDDVRGTNAALQPNLTNATDSPVGFGTDGFGFDGVSNQLRIFTSDGRYNTNGNAYVTWGWKGSGVAGVTNTAGTITSTVSANTSAGFSIVTWTGNGVNNATVGHGLSVTPAMIIVKSRTQTYNWDIYHQSLGIAATLTFTTSATRNVNAFGTNNPTSSLFSVYTNYTNDSGANYVAYCFAQVAGYSAFGSYTGNGSTDGPFVFTGFRPKYILIKRTDTTASWYVYDTVRQNYNAMGAQTDPLLPNSSSAEGGPDASWYIDALSNGFKIRNASNFDNNSSGTYIYACFAESPFKYANAR